MKPRAPIRPSSSWLVATVVPSSATTSVKVPPVSTAIRILAGSVMVPIEYSTDGAPRWQLLPSSGSAHRCSVDDVTIRPRVREGGRAGLEQVAGVPAEQIKVPVGEVVEDLRDAGARG